MKNLLTIGLIGGLLFFGSRVLGAKRISDKSVVRTLNPRIHKVDISGIVIRTEIVIDNPTNEIITVTKPVITLSSGGKYIASSVPENKVITINGMSQTSLDTAEITIPWTSFSGYISSLFSKIPALINSYRKTGKLSFASLSLPLEYKYSTYVNDLYYESNPEKIA